MTLMFCEFVVLYRNINKEKSCYFVLLIDLFCTMYRKLLSEYKINLEHIFSNTCKSKAYRPEVAQLPV